MRRASSSSSSRSSVRTRFSSSQSSSSVRASRIDPAPDLTVRSNFLLLGEATPVLGAVDFFAAQEPIDVDTIRVRFSSDPSSIQQVRVYAQADGALLGTSFRDGSGDYEIAVKPGTLILPHRAEEGVYVRALMKPADSGASGGQIVQIEHVEMDGDGVWSDTDYTVTSTETFLQFETTPAVITGFSSATSMFSSAFVPGSSVTLWDYDVSARSTDNDFEVALNSITFRLAKSSDVSLSDVELSVPGGGVSTSCTVSTGTIVCNGIPESVGAVDSTKRLRLTADVTLAPGATNPFLQATLQEAGTPSNPGDVEWTDGHSTYDWLPFEEPVARGTLYQ